MSSLSTRQREPLVEGGGVTMAHLIVSGCKVEVLLVRDMFDKNGKKDSKPKGVARPCGALKLKPFICQRVKEQCSLSSLSTRQREPLLEGGGEEREKFKYAKRTSV